VRYEDISDGTAHTMFVGEKFPDQKDDLGWMSGTRWSLRNTGVALNSENEERNRSRYQGYPPSEKPSPEVIVGGFSSPHPGGANFAFGDAHVSFVSETIPLETLQQLAHRADGKLLMRGDF
jgi:prepilin-type processing-associated H-X9-DG protein